MSEKLNTPSPTLTFSVEGNSYTVNYPKNGQFIQIESMKISMTRSTYGAMALESTISAQMARYTVDMIAFFHTCCPEMKADLKVETFSDLDVISNKRLLKVYINEVLPWLVKWEDFLNQDEEKKAEA